MPELDRTALVVVDVQQAFADAAYWGRRNNPGCEANVATLLATWRAAQRPVVFVRHDSDEPASPLHPGEPGNAFKPEIDGEPDLLVAKQVNSAFHGDPDLAAWLRGHTRSTARAHTFDRKGPDGTWMSADTLARATATSLHGEFATVVSTDDLLE